MDSELSANGLFVDNLHVLRIIDPSIGHDTVDLKDEAKYYSSKLDDFHQSIQEVLVLVKKFNEDVDREKLKTIGAENLLKATSRKQDMERQEVQSQIMEKTMELDRLKAEYQMLARVESQQKEIIDHFYQNQ